jgi:hypothetical protein
MTGQGHPRSICAFRVHPYQRKERSELTVSRFTFLSTLFLLLVVSTAIVLRSFLLRRRYRMGLQEQLDDLFRQPGGTPGASRRKNFGAKPKLWDTWIELDDRGKGPVNELAGIKVRCVAIPPPLKAQCLPSSRSPLHLSHKRQQSPKTRLLHHRFHSPSKNAGKSGPPPSWLAFSPTHFHSRDTNTKTIVLELTLPTRPQKYLAPFKSR